MTEKVVVLDSNVWLTHDMLRHAAGSAVRYHLRRTGTKLALPAVVKQEVTLHLGRRLRQLATAMKTSHEELLRIVGQLRELVLPTEAELLIHADNAFAATGLEFIEIPFSLKSAHASFEKCLRGLSPSGEKNQQFKDGVIWADCLELAETYAVHLVTQDKGFYLDRSYASGLAANLLAEQSNTRFGVTLSHELRSILQLLSGAPTIDVEALEEGLRDVARSEFERVAERQFSVGPPTWSHKIYATDDPNEAYVEFSVVFECHHDDGRTGRLSIEGHGNYSTSSKLVKRIGLERSSFEYQGEDGSTQRTGSIVYGMGTAWAGHRIIKHEIRELLDDEIRKR